MLRAIASATFVAVAVVVLSLYARADQIEPEGVRVEPTATPAPALKSADETHAAQDATPRADAESSPLPAAGEAGTSEDLSHTERARRAELSTAMHEELRILREQTLAQVSELSEASAKATSEQVIQELHATISQLKQNELAESLRVQARYARLVGNEALSQEIDATIERLLSPSIDATSADRTPQPRNHPQR